MITFEEQRDDQGFLRAMIVKHGHKKVGTLTASRALILRDGSSRGGWSVSIPGHYDDGICLFNDYEQVKDIIVRDWDKSGHLLKGDQNGAIIGAKEKGEDGRAPESKSSTAKSKGGKKMDPKIRIVKTKGKRELTLTFARTPVTVIGHNEKVGWHFDAKFRAFLKKSKINTEAGYKKRGDIHQLVDEWNARGVLEPALHKRVEAAKAADKKAAQK